MGSPPVQCALVEKSLSPSVSRGETVAWLFAGRLTVGPSTVATALEVLGGYMTTSSGRELVFTVNVNNVPIKGMDDMLPVLEKHASIMEKIYEAY